MLRPLWTLSIWVRLFLRTYILLDAPRTEVARAHHAHRRAVPARRVAPDRLDRRRRAGWLNLLVLLFIWNALKFLVNGPITLVILIRARLAERRDRRIVERESAAYAAGIDLSVLTATRLCPGRIGIADGTAEAGMRSVRTPVR